MREIRTSGSAGAPARAIPWSHAEEHGSGATMIDSGAIVKRTTLTKRGGRRRSVSSDGLGEGRSDGRPAKRDGRSKTWRAACEKGRSERAQRKGAAKGRSERAQHGDVAPRRNWRRWANCPKHGRGRSRVRSAQRDFSSLSELRYHYEHCCAHCARVVGGIHYERILGTGCTPPWS